MWDLPGGPMPPAPQCPHSKRSGPNNETVFNFAIACWTFGENKDVAPAVEQNGGHGQKS